ncbi:MAG TPA: ribbon-helix-helix protein, CopG family [Methylophilaceae bacterium]|nr:ribbon-helix-helix protein, CopG family [Methylophilaceae bacterium]
MEKRTARLTILIDPAKKEILEEICAQHDLTSSQVIRSLIREYINQHGTPEQQARMPAFKKGPKSSKNK